MGSDRLPSIHVFIKAGHYETNREAPTTGGHFPVEPIMFGIAVPRKSETEIF